MAQLDGGSYAATYNAYMKHSFAVQKTSMLWGNTGEEALEGFALPWKNEVPSVQEAKESVVLAEETEDLIEGPVLSKGDRIAGNKATGDAWSDELSDFFTSNGKIVKREVVKKTPFGPRRVDLQVSDGEEVLGGIEAKVGNSRYTPSQRAKDWWLQHCDNYPVVVVRKP